MLPNYHHYSLLLWFNHSKSVWSCLVSIKMVYYDSKPMVSTKKRSVNKTQIVFTRSGYWDNKYIVNENEIVKIRSQATLQLCTSGKHSAQSSDSAIQTTAGFPKEFLLYEDGNFIGHLEIQLSIHRLSWRAIRVNLITTHSSVSHIMFLIKMKLPREFKGCKFYHFVLIRPVMRVDAALNTVIRGSKQKTVPKKIKFSLIFYTFRLGNNKIKTNVRVMVIHGCVLAKRLVHINLSNRRLVQAACKFCYSLHVGRLVQCLNVSWP